MEVIGMPDEFWVVLNPEKDSELEDILYHATWSQFMDLARDGLTVSDIGAICCAECTARNLAATFLKIRNNAAKVAERAIEKYKEQVALKRLNEDQVAVDEFLEFLEGIIDCIDKIPPDSRQNQGEKGLNQDSNVFDGDPENHS